MNACPSVTASNRGYRAHCRADGVASFDLLRNHRDHATAFLYVFELIELNGDELRRDPTKAA
jgi:hypothetical protein